MAKFYTGSDLLRTQYIPIIILLAVVDLLNGLNNAFDYKIILQRNTFIRFMKQATRKIF